MIGAVAFAGLLALAASAADDAGGWVTRGASLLFYGADGQLVSETGLISSEETSDGRLVIRETRGGASKSKRFAWTFERTRAFNASRARLLDSHRALTIHGPRGEAIWTSAEADATDTLDPVVMSDDGEVMLVSSRGKDGWRVAAKGYLGNTILELYPAPELEDMRLTPDGKYALVRWTVPDKEATHTFWSLAAKARRDIPSSELHLGKAELMPNGRVLSNGKLVLDLTKLPAAPEPAVEKPETKKP